MAARSSKPTRVVRATLRASLLLALLSVCPLGCRHNDPPSTITFTDVPFNNPGGAGTGGHFAGKVTNPLAGDRIVIYAFSGTHWWVQPTALQPFTPVQADGSWSAQIHLGNKYAALLVRGDFEAQPTRQNMPTLSRRVWAEATVDGIPQPPSRAKIIHFSGYDWDVHEEMNNIGGKAHRYDPDNVWVDSEGHLHMRAIQTKYEWVCAEANTQRSLGYGTYRYDVRNPSAMEAAAMLSLNTWSPEFDGQNHHELDVHISRWGNPESKNAEFVVQPYYVPSNVYRFELPTGPVSFAFHWLPGSAAFTATQPGSSNPVASWNFTSNVPTSGPEKAYLSLCEYSFGKASLQHDTEVVIDRFQFLP